MKKKFLFIGVLALCLILIFAFVTIGSATPTTTLDDETLAEKALTEAQMIGLIGTPKAQKTARMSLSEWNMLIDADLGMDADKFGLTPDIPVFVLAIRGNVEWRAPGLPQPGQELIERYDNITVVLDARTGDLIWVGAYYPDHPMPVVVP